jgi:Ca-activated chloride channel family protein
MAADFYALIGVTPTATQDQIRQAYQALATRLQTDASPGSANAERLRLLTEAFRVLASQPLRAEYDAQRKAVANGAIPSGANQAAITTPPLARVTQGPHGIESATSQSLRVTLGRPVSAQLEEPERFYILAELSPANALAAPPSAPLNLALMTPRAMILRDPGLTETRRALDALTSLLRPEDQFTLIAFDEQAHVLLDGESVAGRQDVSEALEVLPPRGAARLSSALSLALERLATHIKPTSVSALALITDAPITGEEARLLMELAERARQLGVAIIALGVGLEWNRDALDHIASATGGTCAFVDEPRYLTHALADLVERLHATLASRLRLTLEPAPGVSILRAAQVAPELAYTFEGPHTPGAPVAVELGALAGGPEARGSAALWETLLEPSTLTLSAEGQIELGNIHSAYWALWQDGGRMVRASAPVRATRAAPSVTPHALAPDIRLALELLTAYRLQTRADRLVTSGDVEGAREALETSALRMASAGAANLAEEARQSASALSHGLARAAVATLRTRYSIRNQSPFHHLRRALGGRAGA